MRVAAAVQEALSAPIAERAARLIDLDEDQWFDRKSGRIQPRDLGPPLVAFANAEGGVIVVGLHGGSVQGIAETEKVNAFRQASVDFTSPPVRAYTEEIQCQDVSGQVRRLVVITVLPGEHVHELTNGDCFLRVGDESRRLNFVQRQELEFDRGQRQFDGHPSNRPLSDLDGDRLEQYRIAVGATSVESLLKARGLVDRDDRPTIAAHLLFASHPQDVLPEAHVRVLRFLEKDRGTGARLGLDDAADVRLDGPIAEVIELATAEVDRLLPRRRRLGSSGLFEAVPIVPRDAWREGIVNAVIHRSYSLSGDHIRVEIYPDRIEIESPGRFPGLADPSRPLEISRFARNPRIARVCAELRIGQELGEGIKRMFDEMRSAGLRDPLFRQGQASVKLTLTAVPKLDPAVERRLPRDSSRVLDALRAAGRPLSTGDVCAAIGLSRPAGIVRLRALLDEGLVIWDGKSARDPRAAWSLPE